MKKITLLFAFALVVSVTVNAQYELPVTWENEGETDAWTPFENAGDAPENFVIVANPDNTGINTSANSLMYTVLPAAAPWVGAWSTAYGEMVFTEENHMMEMMVYKSVISDCALKVEGGGLDPVEVKVANTVTDEWELLTFDFTNAIGSTRPTLVFFPDFPSARTEGSVCYVDNIGWASDAPNAINNLQKENFRVYPNPSSDKVIINYNNITELRISNALGQTIRDEKFSAVNTKTTDISSLDNGLYFVTIRTSEGYVSSKFLKK